MSATHQFKRQQRTKSPVDIQNDSKQNLSFRRPPSGAAQNSVTPNTSTMLRRVSSVQNQNGSVSESLQQFMQCRSNSAARSNSQGALSSQNEEIIPNKIRIAKEKSDKSQHDQDCDKNVDALKRDASSSMERVEKYLRRDGSGSQEMQQSRTLQTTIRDKEGALPGQTKIFKLPRAQSQNANKQVRFDIKEGLKEMIKEQGPAFNAAQVHKQLMDKHRMQKQQLKTRQSADDLKLSLVSQNYSDLQQSNNHVGRKAEQKNMNAKQSPAFGSSYRGGQQNNNSTVRKSTPKQTHLNRTALSGTSSARRYRQIISPKSSSSKKHAYNLALRYQKEVLESKVRKGQINLSKLNVAPATESNHLKNDNEGQQEQQFEHITPQSNRILPPKPTQLTNLISEVVQNDDGVDAEHNNDHPDGSNNYGYFVEDGGQRAETQHLQEQQRQNGDQNGQRQSAISQPRCERKAGSICRLRSESPIMRVVGSGQKFQNKKAGGDKQDFGGSQQATCEDDDDAPIAATTLDNYENMTTNRTFYAGQIIKLSTTIGKQQSLTSRAKPFSNRKSSLPQQQQSKLGCSSDMPMSVTYQESIGPHHHHNQQPLDMQQTTTDQERNSAMSPALISSTPGQSPKFPTNTNGCNDDQNPTTQQYVMSSYINSTTPLSQQSFVQNPLQNQNVGIFSQEDEYLGCQGGAGQTDRSEQEMDEFQNSGHFPTGQYGSNNQDLFKSIWDTFLISEPEFLQMTSQFCQFVEISKQALHEPLRQDEEAAGLSSARQMQKGIQVPRQRLRLIRLHLKNVLLDSFLPLIHEIIQLRDRLYYRKQTYRQSIRNTLKASIISDICSRLKQKIVLKVLFLKSQYRKNLHSLFQAYHDLLVNKQIVRATFDQVRTFKQRRIEKSAYLDYAKSQISELRKVQIFDSLKRFGQIVRLEEEKQRQARAILGKRNLKRILIAWKSHMVGKRVSQISHEMIQKFQVMKHRHQLFAKWVNVHKVSKKIKAKALQLVCRQQDEKSKALYTESDFVTERSSTSLQEQADAECQLSQVKNRSEEIFYRHIQELLLEKEHHQTILKRYRQSMQAVELDLTIPVYFDQISNPEIWNTQPSQAYLSNKEQIYTLYPELQKNTMSQVPAKLRQPSISVAHASISTIPGSQKQPSESQQNLTKSVSDLKYALQPPIHKFMVCPQPSQQTLITQENVLGTKYSVHQMLVAQQNMYGLKSTAAKKSELDSTDNHETSDLRHELSQIDDQNNHGLAATSNEIDHNTNILCSESVLNSSMPFRSTIVSNGQVVKAIPFKKQTKDGQASYMPPLYMDNNNTRNTMTGPSPNQLFQKLQKQNQDLNSNAIPATSKLGAKNGGVKLPVEIQIKSHLKDMVALLSDGWSSQGSSKDMIRAKAMCMAISELQATSNNELQNTQKLPLPQEGMSLADFTQVAMQAGISLLHLNDLQMKATYTELWRERLIVSLIAKDMGELRTISFAKSALKEWQMHMSKQKLRAVNHSKTKQMQNFYRLFTQWSKVNRQLVYETERTVRSFKMQQVLKYWKVVHQKTGKHKRLDRAAIKFYVRSLHARALASLFQNKRRLINCKKFERRQALIKFFKRRWLPMCRARLLLRRVLDRCQERDQSQDRSRYQRQYDLLRGAISTWKKRVLEKQMLYKNYMAVNHYKISLVYRHFMALKNAPIKTAAIHKLVPSLLSIAMQKPFDQMLKVCAAQNLRVRDWKQARDQYIQKNFIAHLHALAVKTKIAKLFVQRKFLKALQKHIFKHNYMRPLAFREHQLRSKALFALRNRKGDKWKRQRMDIVYRALLHRKQKTTLIDCFNGLKQITLQDKRDRIIEGTVMDFRKHTLIEKSFKLLKLHRISRHKKTLLNQVADEFHEERLKSEIEYGRTQVRLNTQTGCLLNANQDLLLKVMTEWKFISRSLRRNKYQLEHKMVTKKQMLILRCFLAWRSFTRYEQSDLSQLDNGAAGGSKSAISYLDVIDGTFDEAISRGGDSSNSKPLRQNKSRQQALMKGINSYDPYSAQKSKSALSYVNTEQESVSKVIAAHIVNTQEPKAIVAHVDSQSSFITSLIDSSQQLGQRSTSKKMSMGQFNKVGGGPRFGGTGQFLTQDDGNSESTLNARAPPYQGGNHLKSSSHLGTTQQQQMHLLQDQSLALLSNPSSSQLNQRQVNHGVPPYPTLMNKQHQHHASMPDYNNAYAANENRAPSSYAPGMYQDTSEFASGPECGKTAGDDHTAGSVESFQNNKHFGKIVGFSHHHQHGISAEETVLTPPEEFLSVNDVLSKGETTQGEFTYEQLTKEASGKNEQRRRQRPLGDEPPALVTTLNPYNYEIDLPLKQASSSNVSNLAAQQRQMQQIQQQSQLRKQKQYQQQLYSNDNRQQQDYATFSIQECEQAPLQDNEQNDNRHNRVFSSHNAQCHDQDSDSSVQSTDYQALRGRGQNNQAHDESQVDRSQSQQNDKKQALQKHLGSLTLSNGTGVGNLCDELESIFRHNDDFTGEQEQRDAFLKDLANHYQTQLTSQNAAFNTVSVANGSITIEDENQHQLLKSHHQNSEPYNINKNGGDPSEFVDSSNYQDSSLEVSQNETKAVRPMTALRNRNMKMIQPYIAAAESPEQRGDEGYLHHREQQQQERMNMQQSSYIQSDSDTSQYEKQSQMMSASFAGGNEGDKSQYSENTQQVTQEDEIVSAVSNPMDSRIYNN